jgi:hypothetical protein
MSLAVNEKGIGSFKVYLFFLMLFLAIHAGFKLVPMYMDHERMKDEMATKAAVAQVLKDEEIVKDLVTKARELDIPLTAESFILERDQDRRTMKISTKEGWDVEQNFLWGTYIRTFHFEPVVQENIMSVNR